MKNLEFALNLRNTEFWVQGFGRRKRVKLKHKFKTRLQNTTLGHSHALSWYNFFFTILKNKAQESVVQTISNLHEFKNCHVA